MSFTQKQRRNINSKSNVPYDYLSECHGCAMRCAFGRAYGTRQNYVYPTIGGKIIKRYIDADNKVRFAGIAADGLVYSFHKLAAHYKAAKIAKLCDRYKRR